MHFIILFMLILAGTFTIPLSAQEENGQFREPFEKSFPIRKQQHLELNEYLERYAEGSKDNALRYFNPDFSNAERYAASISKYRQELAEMIGYPPPGALYNSEPRIEKIGEDADAVFYRIWVRILDGVDSYGIYMVPRSYVGRLSLIISIHGGSGCPEAICDIDTRGAYNAWGREAVRRGYAVWAPGLLMQVSYGGDPEIEDAHRYLIDRKAKVLGISLVAIEVFKILQGAEALLRSREEIDPDKIGVAGLSYGGYFTLMTSAMASYVKASVCSGIFRENTGRVIRSVKNPDSGGDVMFFNVLNRFGHAQLAGLICPRPLLIQNGKNDPVIDITSTRREIPFARLYYQKIGMEDRLRYVEHEGGHEFDIGSAFRFLDEYLK